MPNIMLTDYCNQDCPYCFAQEMMSRKGRDISFMKFKKAVDYLKRSGVGRIGIIGGEPTLHPRFLQLLDYVVEKGMSVRLYTNGLTSKDVCTGLAEYDAKVLEVLLNLNDRRSYSKGQLAQVNFFMEHLNEKLNLGYTIWELDFSLGFHRDMILKYDLPKAVRIGLASPIVRRQSRDFFHPSDFPRIGRAIIKQVELLEQDDILVGFDCGFVMCMFSTRALGILTRKSVGFSSQCRPIIDIDLELNATPCFPLGGVLRKPIDDFPDLDALKDHFSGRLESLKVFGNNGKCMSCKYFKRRQCRGWCLARIINCQEGLMDKFAGLGV